MAQDVHRTVRCELPRSAPSRAVGAFKRPAISRSAIARTQYHVTAHMLQTSENGGITGQQCKIPLSLRIIVSLIYLYLLLSN